MTSAARDRYGSPTEVCDVYGYPSARFEFADAFGEHLSQHLQVLDVGRRDVLGVQLGFVCLAGKIGWRGDDQSDGPIGDTGHVGGVAVEQPVDVPAEGIRRDLVVGGELRRTEPGVEIRCVVTLAFSDTEGRG